MTDINANVDASQEWLPLTEADSLSLASGYYTLDSENVKVEAGPHPASSVSNPIPKYNGRRAVRGVGGSTAVSHLSGATLIRYYVDGPSTGGGAGGVTVDNTVDAPFVASTLIAAGATESAPDEATLPDPTQMAGEEIVLTNPDERSDGGQFVTFEASDGEVYKLQTSGASTQTLIEGASAQIVRDTGGAVLVVGFTGVIAKGASNDLIATVRATDALGFYGATPIARPEVPATPTEQDIADALVVLGLVTQAAP